MRRLLLPVLLAVSIASASAQPMWRPGLDGPSVSVDVLKPFEDRQIATDDQGNVIAEFGPALLHSAQIVSARISVNPIWAVVADLPMAYSRYNMPEGFSNPEVFEGEFGIGNPYVGVEAAALADLVVEAGVRLPLSARGANGFGVGASFTGATSLRETVEAYLEETSSAVLGARFEPALLPGLRLRLRAVSSVLRYPTFLQVGERVQEVRETDLALHYGVQAIGLVGPAELVGGVVGRTDGADRLFDPIALTLGASVNGLPVRPGLRVRLPLRGYSFGPDAVVGLSLDVPLR